MAYYFWPADNELLERKIDAFQRLLQVRRFPSVFGDRQSSRDTATLNALFRADSALGERTATSLCRSGEENAVAAAAAAAADADAILSPVFSGCRSQFSVG